MSDPADTAAADAPEAEAEPRDPWRDALRDARPTHEDVVASLIRARAASKLFGASDAVRVGRYELESRAGAGGSGDVFAARDPELNRRVAIKLMRAGGYRDRMLAEGHALARLSHPNIVPVYDAGTLDDQVYVVMELIEGDTLRAYCAAPDRSVREIVRAYRQAAEGLAAAHRAGFIHRDFKPDNAVVGRDGRVRIVDFGLARGADGSDAEARGSAGVTRAGLGTPRYMAPEQATGATLTPAADQYAFCVSLREGLLARAPAVPRWLEPILRRGSATDPADRYASMADLQAALARDPAARWRARGLVAGALGLAAAAFVLGRGRAVAPSCDQAAAELATAWSAIAPAQVAVHLAGLGTPYARHAAPHVVTALDRYASRWRAGHRDACIAHRDGSQSAALFDRRVACLARARAALRSAVGAVEAAGAGQLADTIKALGELPDLDRCSDPSALTTTVAPPRPADAPAVAALFDQLAALEVEVRAARPDVRPRIAQLVTRARDLGYAPVVARALWLAGLAALAVDARAEAVTPLGEATTLALTAGDRALATDAFALRLYCAGTLAESAGTARAGAELIQAIAAGLPPSDRAASMRLDNSLGSVALAAGDRAQARDAFERALRTARQGPITPELAGTWSNLALVLDDPARRRALAGERVAIVEAGLGPGHPLALEARITAAYFETDPRRTRDALEPPCDELVALHPELGFDILQCQFELGWLAVERGDDDRARAAFLRAAATQRTGGDGPKLAIARAHLERLAGRAAGAASALDAARAEVGPLDRAPWWVLADFADAMLARGALDHSAGRGADARTAFDTARRALETVLASSNLPANARRLAYAQASLARTWAAPLPLDARRHAEAALAWYRGAGGYDDVVAELARALAR